MEAQRRVRDICKADKCLVANQESQELLARNHIRFLRNLMTRKYQLNAYLELIDIHIEQGTIPPGLRIDLAPPGYSQAMYDGFFQWSVKTNRCSRDLMHLLRKKYVSDLKRLEKLVKSSVFQLTAIFCSLKGITRECARLEVSDLVGKIAEESNRVLLESFDKAADKYFLSGITLRSKTEADILDVSAGTNHR